MNHLTIIRTVLLRTYSSLWWEIQSSFTCWLFTCSFLAILIETNLLQINYWHFFLVKPEALRYDLMIDIRFLDIALAEKTLPQKGELSFLQV